MPSQIMTLFVNVKDNNVEQAIRSLKKKMQREGFIKKWNLENILKNLV